MMKINTQVTLSEEQWTQFEALQEGLNLTPEDLFALAVEYLSVFGKTRPVELLQDLREKGSVEGRILRAGELDATIDLKDDMYEEIVEGGEDALEDVLRDLPSSTALPLSLINPPIQNGVVISLSPEAFNAALKGCPVVLSLGGQDE